MTTSVHWDGLRVPRYMHIEQKEVHHYLELHTLPSTRGNCDINRLNRRRFRQVHCAESLGQVRGLFARFLLTKRARDRKARSSFNQWERHGDVRQTAYKLIGRCAQLVSIEATSFVAIFATTRNGTTHGELLGTLPPLGHMCSWSSLDPFHILALIRHLGTCYGHEPRAV